MKKLITILLCLALACSSASAEIRLMDTAVVEESKVAAGEYGAEDAYFSPTDNNIYYLAKSGDKFTVVILGETGDYETVHTFEDTSAYTSIRTGEDGSIYLLKQQSDESMKSGVLCLTGEPGAYSQIEFLFPAASCDLIPRKLEFSPDSSSGSILFYICNNAGDYVSALSIFNLFWGALEGYDSFILITPGALTADVVPMETLFDVYGYANENAQQLANRITNGEMLSPTAASLSPDGEKLLVTVPFEDNTLVYVIDVYSLSLELVYPPENFSGMIGWTEDGTLRTVSDNGEESEIIVGGFSNNSWTDSWADGWADDSWTTSAGDSWGDNILGEWN